MRLPAYATPYRVPPRRRSGGWVVGCLAIVGVLVLGLIMLGVLGGILTGGSDRADSRPTDVAAPTSLNIEQTAVTAFPSDEPTTGQPTDEPTTEQPTTEQPTTEPATAEPTTQQPAIPPGSVNQLNSANPSDPVLHTLQANRLYGYSPPVGTCQAQRRPQSKDEWHRQTQALLDCQYGAWLKVFTRMGRSLPKPQLVFYAKTVQSPCGVAGANEPAFYCSGNQMIYVGDQTWTTLQDGLRLWNAQTIVHEFFHHVQAQAGILDAAYQTSNPPLEMSRRVELQTTCVVNRILAYTPGFAFTRDDYDEFTRWLTYDQNNEHGTAESMTLWGGRGWYASTIQHCNTFVVEAKYVR